MEHHIEKEPLSFFLQQVYLKNLSGSLEIACRDFQTNLYFQGGKLINGMSTRFDEKISVILHLMGIINEEQYNFLSGLHQFADDQVSAMLLDHNFAKKNDIFFARIYQLRRIAISTFSLQTGKWSFFPDEPHPPFRETFEIPLAGILVEGARSIDHVSFYSNRWLLREPIPFKEIPPLVEIYFTDPELDFHAHLSALSPQRTCQELIALLNILPVDFWRKILVFHLLGLLQFQKSEGHVDIGRDIAALLEINQKLQAPGGDVFFLLGLAADTPLERMEIARNKMLLRFAPERFGSAAAPEIKKIARAVCDRLRSAEVRLDAEPLPQVEPLPQKIPAVAKQWLDEDFSATPELELPFSPAAAPPAMNIAASDHEKAWAMLLKGKELYEQREFDKAIGFLKQAIKLEPGQGDFYYLLGLCQGEMEVMKNDAEISLKKAIELKSWSADPVYALGILYRGQGKMKLAERCFQRVKEISYEHTGASRALVDLRRIRAREKPAPPLFKKKRS
ncbi:MAG: DUF4388 domain-containing protein [Candidatus Aminicenantes bacterium]|nr:DUF4388 domain-containing protein [Candidatus Aminicenantes bacterium]